jgi:hypothetical protein
MERYNVGTNLRAQLSGLTYAAKDYIMQDLEPYRRAAKAAGYDLTQCAQIEELYAANREFERLQGFINKNLGLLIVQRGDGYEVSRPDGSKEVSATHATLSGSVRGALGKLKLVEPHTTVANVGCRVTADTFFTTCYSE